VDSEENLMLKSRLKKYNKLWHITRYKQKSIRYLPSQTTRNEKDLKMHFLLCKQQRVQNLRDINMTERTLDLTFKLTDLQVQVLQTTASQTPYVFIALPTFSGNYEQWQQFYDIFKALIHNNSNLNTLFRNFIIYGPHCQVAQIIHAVSTTNENYSISLELLIKRFSNKHLTVHHHVHELFNSSPIVKESTELLHALLDNVQKHLRVLQQLKKFTNKLDVLIIYLLFIIYLVSSKLNAMTKQEWKLKIIKERAFITKQLIEFLNMRCEFLEALHSIQAKAASGRNAMSKPS